MKKKILMGVLIMSMIMFGACSNQDGINSIQNDNSETSHVNSSADAQEDITKDNKKKEVQNTEVSLEALKMQPVSPASDFQVSPHFDGVMIDKYLGKDELVVIPNEIDGKKVLKLNSFVFEGTNMKGVKLPDYVESLEVTFLSNDDVKYVICGSSLKVVYDSTFASCSSLETVEFQEGLTTIKPYAFNGCKNLKVLYIPESVTEMETLSLWAMGEGFTIQGKSGSLAEEIATQKGCGFEVVD